MSKCAHTIVDADAAWAIDGLCAYCLKTDNERLRAELDQLKALLKSSCYPLKTDPTPVIKKFPGPQPRWKRS